MAEEHKSLTFNSAMEMRPEDLINHLEEMCAETIPTSMETVEDLEKAEMIMSKYASLYAYLNSMQIMAKVMKKQYKKNKEDKEKADEALIREEIFGSFADSVKSLSGAVSRMVTIRQQINNEMRMF